MKKIIYFVLVVIFVSLIVILSNKNNSSNITEVSFDKFKKLLEEKEEGIFLLWSRWL